MFTVTVKNSIMIAHSLPDPFFGPAQNMHGATFEVEAEFKSATLTDKNVVIDIGEASNILADVLGKFNYQNLDELPQFKGILTTTEFMAQHIHSLINAQISDDIGLKITLHESSTASASYEG